MADDLKIGDTVKAGTVILMTYGSYSQYGVSGVYRVTSDFTIKALSGAYQDRPDFSDVDAHCEEIKTCELWGGD